MRKIALLTVLLFAVFTADAQDKKILSFHEETFVTTGPSLQNGTIDVKFQMSFKVYPVTLGQKWEMYMAYTQTTVWNAYQKSSPFRDNVYKPGLFFECRKDERNTLTVGLEHRSNGRPYFGNPIASWEVEDYSRGMNYAMIRWNHILNERFVLDLTARAGIGCGVDRYPRHENLYTQDLFVYYLGYVDAKITYTIGKLATSAMITPVWNKSIANVTANFTYRFNEKWPALFAQFHYGYDEAMCDCTQGFVPPCHIRIGFRL